MPLGRSSPPGSRAPTPCPTPPRWRPCWRRPSMREEQHRAILEARSRNPDAIIEAAARRVRPASLFNEHGRLMIIAADHPARGALRAGEGALDGKVVIGSMNRGGLAGTVFEIDDRFTGYDATALAVAGFEGGKMLLRIDPEDPATVATVEACARAVGELAE